MDHLDGILKTLLAGGAMFGIWDLERRNIAAGHNGTMLRMAIVAMAVVAGVAGDDVIRQLSTVVLS